MFKNISCKLTSATLLSILVPTIGFATPHAMLEKAQTYALDSQIRAFQAPTVDSKGKIKYYDMTIKLTVKNDGSVSPIASVSSHPSTSIRNGALVAGTYKSAAGASICKVTNIPLTNGRFQSFFICKYDYLNSGGNYELSVVTGSVAAGHPYFSELAPYGIAKRSDVNTQAWGIVTNGDYSNTGCGILVDTGTPLSAKTDGNTLILSYYNNGSPSKLACSAIFTKQP